MKYILVMVLIVSGVVLAKPSSHEQKLIQEAGENLGSNMAFSREINVDNIEKTCLSNVKRVSFSIEKTSEIENMAAEYCVSQWKSLQ